MTEQTEVLGSQNIAIDGPFKLTITVHLTGVEGTEFEGMDANADIDLPPGMVPTEESIIQALKNAQAHCGDNFKLSTRKDFVNSLLVERTGADMNFSIPGPKDFRLIVE